jgi:hypothetical protein
MIGNHGSNAAPVAKSLFNQQFAAHALVGKSGKHLRASDALIVRSSDLPLPLSPCRLPTKVVNDKGRGTSGPLWHSLTGHSTSRGTFENRLRN